MIHLGVATKILGQERLRSETTREGEPGAHLSLRLLRLSAVLRYLEAQDIHFYRLPDDLLAPARNGESPAAQLAAAADMLGIVSDQARSAAIRLTIHPSLGAALGAAHPDAVERAAATIVAQAALLDALGAGRESVIVLHVGGEGDDRAAVLERFAARFERLPSAARRRIALEHDSERFDLVAVLRLHRLTGIPVIFDMLHFQLRNPQQLGLAEALGLALATWPPGVRAEAHLSSQRTEAHLQARPRAAPHIIAPRPGQHSDYVNPFECIQLLGAARGLAPFDLMLEAKAADLALLRLRDDLRRYAPELGNRVL